MEGSQTHKVNSHSDNIAYPQNILNQVSYIIVPINKEMKFEKDEILKLFTDSNFSSSSSQVKKYEIEKENFSIINEEIKIKVYEEIFKEEASSEKCKNTLQYEMPICDGTEKMNSEIDSDSEFININEVIQSDYHDPDNSNIISDGDEIKNELSLVKSPQNENEEYISNDYDYISKTCKNCASATVKKGYNFCKKCKFLEEKSSDKSCNCKKPPFKNNLCKSCYERVNNRNIPLSEKICIKCKCRKRMNGRKTCWSCSLTRQKIADKCKCNKPLHAKGLCSSCYFKMKLSEKKQTKANLLPEEKI